MMTLNCTCIPGLNGWESPKETTYRSHCVGGCFSLSNSIKTSLWLSDGRMAIPEIPIRSACYLFTYSMDRLHDNGSHRFLKAFIPFCWCLKCQITEVALRCDWCPKVCPTLGASPLLYLPQLGASLLPFVTAFIAVQISTCYFLAPIIRSADAQGSTY